jgi:hypothetical protein
MKPTIVASVFVLLSSIGLGIGTGYVSFGLGSESLKGVKSPLDNPSKKIITQEVNLQNKKKFQLMEEKTILTKVYDHIEAQREKNKSTQKKSK